MLTPETVKRLWEVYGLRAGDRVRVPDGREGKLMNVKFDPDVGVVQLLEGNVYHSEKFDLTNISKI
jgi:hypothetical protein